jgi:DNA mismatch endonuclease, patch repair protein
VTDILSPIERSERMRQVRQRGTAPELAVRKMVLDLGFRYRANFRGLPGRPDIVFPKLRRVVFVHGCFWHKHACRQGRVPGSRRKYWLPKLAENRRRDRLKQRMLKNAGWQALVVWQCQLKSPAALARRLDRFLRAAPEGVLPRSKNTQRNNS